MAIINRIVVVGAGPAGMMAALRASELGQEVKLIEKNPVPGKKLLLSGHGRCNLTNTCDLELFLKRFGANGQFLRDAFKKFFHQDLIAFFEKRGLRMKVERQMRVFPVTDKSISICQLLHKELLKNKVKLLLRHRVKDIVLRDKRVRGVILGDNSVLTADRVILATGGASYAFTGSDGKAIELARNLGHRVVALSPGLVPLVARQGIPRLLEGLTLKNIRLKFCNGKREIISDIGEMMFTGSGISGPLILALSGSILDWLKTPQAAVHLEIDLKPALSHEQLHARLLREFQLNPKKALKNVLKSMLPKRLVDVFIEAAKINPVKLVSYVTQGERASMVSLLKAFRLDIIGTLPLEEAMVTRGGVSLKDINPRTMESRIIKGLYFAGEMIDVDADTGGFNLQAAFSTGYLAGESASLN